MKLKKIINKDIETLKFVFSTKKYIFYTIIFGIILFSIFYYFLVAKVANQDLWISVMMSGALFTTISIVLILITSTFSAILFSTIIYQFNNYKKSKKKGFFGFVGSGIAAFGVGCPTCGAFLFGMIGLPLALTYFPLKGLELQIAGIILLLVSLHLTIKPLHSICKIK